MQIVTILIVTILGCYHFDCYHFGWIGRVAANLSLKNRINIYNYYYIFWAVFLPSQLLPY